MHIIPLSYEKHYAYDKELATKANGGAHEAHGAQHGGETVKFELCANLCEAQELYMRPDDLKMQLPHEQTLTNSSSGYHHHGQHGLVGAAGYGHNRYGAHDQVGSHDFITRIYSKRNQIN